MGEVLADLGRVDPGQPRQLPRRHRAELLLGQLDEDPQVLGQPRHRGIGDRRGSLRHARDCIAALCTSSQATGRAPRSQVTGTVGGSDGPLEPGRRPLGHQRAGGGGVHGGTLERWLARRRRHDLAWAAAMALFALGALAYFFGVATGWRAWSFKVFYLLGGVLTVPVLALGTVYLLGGRRLGDRVALAVALVGSFSDRRGADRPAAAPARHRPPQRRTRGAGRRAPDPGRGRLGPGRHRGDRRGAVERVAPLAGPAGGRPRGSRPAPGPPPGGWPPPTWRSPSARSLISVKRPFELITGSDETGFALALSVGPRRDVRRLPARRPRRRARPAGGDPRPVRRRAGVPSERRSRPLASIVADAASAASRVERQRPRSASGRSSRRTTLPRHTLGQLVDEPDLRRALVAGEASRAEVDHVVLLDRLRARRARRRPSPPRRCGGGARRPRPPRPRRVLEQHRPRPRPGTR